MNKDLYRKLQMRLDNYSLGFPETGSGIEIEILKRLFNEDDARLFLAMSPKLEEPASVAERIGRPVEETAARLEEMTRRGLLFRLRKNDINKYGAIPFMHGLVEFQVKRFGHGLGELLERYFEEGFYDAIASTGGLFLRTVPVHQSVRMDSSVASFEDASLILKNADIIAVAPCICRTAKESVDKACGKPVETCFMFGSMARYYIDYGLGREIDLAEAMRILAASQEAGLVTQPGTAQNPAGMCNCCGDCCGVLAAVKRHPRPAEIVFSNYQARVDDSLCNGCETCLDRCQMEAITIDDGIARVNPDRCIGCGLCVTTCAAGALGLSAKSADRCKTPPATSADQMMALARKRGLL